jgi:hypothetical protein
LLNDSHRAVLARQIEWNVIIRSRRIDSRAKSEHLLHNGSSRVYDTVYQTSEVIQILGIYSVRCCCHQDLHDLGMAVHGSVMQRNPSIDIWRADVRTAGQRGVQDILLARHGSLVYAIPLVDGIRKVEVDQSSVVQHLLRGWRSVVDGVQEDTADPLSGFLMVHCPRCPLFDETGVSRAYGLQYLHLKLELILTSLRRAVFQFDCRGVCDLLSFSPCLQLEQTCRSLVREIANHIAVETGLHFDGPGKVNLLLSRLRSLSAYVLTASTVQILKYLGSFVPLPKKVSFNHADKSCNKLANLFQNLGESSLVDLNKLLQLVEIVAEQAEALVQSHIAGRQLGGGRSAGLQRALLVEQGSEAEFELRERKSSEPCGGNRVIALRTSASF